MGILKKDDYIKILNYYSIPIAPTDSSKTIKHKAEEILADKLCKCIKKVKKGNNRLEKKGIAICTKSIFNNRGYTRGKFHCSAKQEKQAKQKEKKFVNITKKRKY